MSRHAWKDFALLAGPYLIGVAVGWGRVWWLVPLPVLSLLLSMYIFVLVRRHNRRRSL